MTRGFALPFRVGADGGVEAQSGPEKLRDNVVHILLTTTGERVMRRDYGAGLRRLVHDPINDALLSVVSHQVAKSIAEAEPRVEVSSVRVLAHRPGVPSPASLPSEPPGDAVVVEVDYTIRATREPVSLSVPVGLGGV